MNQLTWSKEAAVEEATALAVQMEIAATRTLTTIHPLLIREISICLLLILLLMLPAIVCVGVSLYYFVKYFVRSGYCDPLSPAAAIPIILISRTNSTVDRHAVVWPVRVGDPSQDYGNIFTNYTPFGGRPLSVAVPSRQHTNTHFTKQKARLNFFFTFLQLPLLFHALGISSRLVGHSLGL